ncbi:MAG TPA: hypothetical protein VGG02_01210 [Chthoniobacterales bacterium]
MTKSRPLNFFHLFSKTSTCDDFLRNTIKAKNLRVNMLAPTVGITHANQAGMQITKAAITWLLQLPDIIICAIVDVIILAMTGNANYTSPLPVLVDVKAANDAAKAALAAAADGGRVLTAIKNAKMAQLVAIVRPLAYYVTVTANGDMAILLSSGFPIQQPTRQPIGPLPTPTAPVATAGEMFGTFFASTVAINGAYIYNWRVALAATPTVFVFQKQTTRADVEVTGMNRGDIYIVQVNAVGAAGPSEYSDAANITAP